MYKAWDKGGDIVAHLLVQHTALRLGLQRLVKSVEVPWRGDAMGDPTSRLPPGVPRDKLATYGNPDCSRLKGLPKHMLQKGPGTLGVTFANFNKASRGGGGGEGDGSLGSGCVACLPVGWRGALRC